MTREEELGKRQPHLRPINHIGGSQPLSLPPSGRGASPSPLSATRVGEEEQPGDWGAASGWAAPRTPLPSGSAGLGQQ